MTANLKRTRTDDAYERLKGEILSGRMSPGSLAPEPDVAASFGMSRTPIREALIRLEGEGLVELMPRRGVRVLPVSPDDMREIYEILAALESEAAAAAVRKGVSDDDLKLLEEITKNMEKALKKDDLDAWAEADDRFHRKIIELSGNRRSADFVNTLFDQVYRARIITLRLREKPVQSTKEHFDILDCIKSGDANKARKALRRHRERAAVELLGILEHCRLGSL